MPKGGGSPEVQPSPAELAQAQQIRWINKTIQKPIVGATIEPAIAALSGAFDTSLSPSERQAIEDQFGQARENIIGNAGARGGMLQKQLVGLDTARAQDVSSAINEAKQRGIERAMTLIPSAYPNASATMGAQGNLAQMGQQRNMYNAQQAANAQSSMFSGIGGIIGSLFGK